MTTRTTTRPSGPRISGARRKPTIRKRSAAQVPAEQRTRNCGGPEDLAHYTCGCGHGFSAGVSTSVSCPRCGSDQAW